jgi:hypothetical protein
VWLGIVQPRSGLQDDASDLDDVRDWIAGYAELLDASADVGNSCATETQATFKRLNMCTGEPKKTRNGKCETLD